MKWSEGSTQVIEIGDGPPLLLIHGGGGAAFHWAPILSMLGQSHRVLAVDRPGHGLADAFDYRGVDVIGHACRFLTDVLEGERLTRVSIAANSMGALFALAFALHRPERVQHLALVGSPFGMERHVPLPLRAPAIPVLKPIVRRVMEHPTPGSTRRFWKRFMVVHPERLGDDFLDAEVASQARNSVSWSTLIERTIDARGVKPEFILGERWQRVSVPTTFVIGERDAIAPVRTVERLVATNGVFGMVAVPDAGHVPWIDSPEAVTAAITRR